MRGDLLKRKKGVHVSLTKETHHAIRVKLFEYGVSLQEVLDEFATRLAREEHYAMKLVEHVAERKLQESLMSLDERRKARDQSMGEFDSETLYELISRSSFVEEDEAQRR